MTQSKRSIETKLEVLEGLGPQSDPDATKSRIKTAIGDRHYRVVAKAAALCSERLFYDLEADLLKAYHRFLQDPLKHDPNCIAKRSIVRALVNLECNNVAFFKAGIHYHQMEPVWGGSVDSAVDLRCSCAMGLVATGHHRALHELTDLLNDPEPNARLGAVRAIACGSPVQTELLLRFKVLTGDPDPEVVGECFTGLLNVEPDESPAFVAPYLADPDAAVREFAALALGESRLDSALGLLLKAWDEQLISTEFRRVLLRAIALHRSDAAFDWLFSIVENAQSPLANDTLETLAIYKHNSSLTNRIRAILAKRDDTTLDRQFAQLWEDA